ncbi:MAG TPA: glutamate 2,3-aminomutase [Peptococcaceae bacterium]|nr:MAG: Lysine 2,3-aminomutase [Clostridia bacterium 41_269]HBT20278.1 glutamate 2,3-aminomutase [Peptococcaceae bacterium]
MADDIMEKRLRAQKRAEELKAKIKDYLEAREKIDYGFKLAEQYEENKRRIMKVLGATEKDWNNWKWHVRNRFTRAEDLAKVINLSEREIKEINEVGKTYRWAVSPYYASLMDPDDPNCPIRKQAIPSIYEITIPFGELDPMAEEYTSPAPTITRRYPDRLIINVTNACAMYCRHCQRRRNIGEVDKAAPTEDILQALDYIRKNEEIRDVLLTGGDAFMLSNSKLDWILTELDKIDHVEIKRLGTRMLVTLPMRVNDELCEILDKHPRLYINTHFNHPKEVTKDSEKACDKLARLGIPLGNQTVLLKGINNDPHVIKKLNHELLKIKVRPYYIFQAKTVKGTGHFITKIEDGINIMEHLRGYTSGLAIPQYIINAPKGFGKTPMLPEYLVSMAPDAVYIRTWEGRMLRYPNISMDDESTEV